MSTIATSRTHKCGTVLNISGAEPCKWLPNSGICISLEKYEAGLIFAYSENTVSGDWEESKGKKCWSCSIRKEWKKQTTWGFIIYKQQILQEEEIESFITILQIWEAYLNRRRFQTFPVTEMMLHGLSPLPAITHIKKWHQEYTKYICSNFNAAGNENSQHLQKAEEWGIHQMWLRISSTMGLRFGICLSACRCCNFSNKTRQETSSHQWNWSSILSWEKYV